MSIVNPLLVYFQAADYDDVLRPLKEIPCDKLILKYMPYPRPHDYAREFFMQHKEYTHIIIHPQDLVVTKEHYFKLVNDLEKYDFPSLAGVCNVGKIGPLKYVWAICMELPTLDRDTRHYNWCPMGKGLGILDVKFEGNMFNFIRRDIAEKRMIDGEFVFRGVDNYNGKASPDLVFAHNCDKLGIPIKVDTDVRMVHLATHNRIKVGKVPPEVYYERWGEKRLKLNPIIPI